MHEYDLVSVQDARNRVAPVGGDEAADALVALGFTEVSGLGRHSAMTEAVDQLIAMVEGLGEELMAEMLALRGTVANKKSDRPPPTDLFLRSPDGTAFACVSGEDNDLSCELETTLANGACVVTFERNKFYETNREARALMVSWPEGGWHSRPAPARDLPELVRLHAEHVTEASKLEGSPPIGHQDADDLVLTRRNSQRVTTNRDNWRAIDTPEPFADWASGNAEELERDPDLLHPVLGAIAAIFDTEGEDRKRQQCVARVPIDALRSSPVKETEREGTIGLWRHWTDAEHNDAIYQRRQLDRGEWPRPEAEMMPIFARYFETVAEAQGQSPLSPDDLEASLARVRAAFSPGEGSHGVLLMEIEGGLRALGQSQGINGPGVRGPRGGC